MSYSSALEVYHKELCKEIEGADYIAIIADETTDVSNKFQLVIVLRYIIGGKPVERFWKFVNPDGHDANAISHCIMKELELVIGNENKLIAQSFDGASVMSGRLNGVQKQIKDKYPYANYIHCYAHQMNLIMSKAASMNRQVRTFFANLSAICSFFSNSSQRTQILDEIVQRRLPRASQTRWNFHSRGVNTVYEYRRDLITVMETIENRNDINLESTLTQACAYKLLLNEINFVFWLTFFHKIMPHVEIIFCQLQKRNIDPVKVRQSLEIFETSIQAIRLQADKIIEEVEHEAHLENGDEAAPSKRRRTALSECKKREALEVCDTILMEIKSRFQFTGHLVATNLFDVKQFESYSNVFPDMYLSEMVKGYPFLDEKRLKSELEVCYSRPELKTISGAVPLLMLILDDDLSETFQETVKLLKLLITMPMSTSEAKQCFSMVKRIKTFLRNTMREDRLTALGMLSCEKTFLNNIDNFNKKVIELFAAKKERRMDFICRSF